VDTDLGSGPATAAGFDLLEQATADLEPPFAVLDVGALRANAADMTRRAAGKPIRVASKSVRCRSILRSVLGVHGYRGVLAFTLPEALWLTGPGGLTGPGRLSGPGGVSDDVVVGYPGTDVNALRELAADPQRASQVTIMVDSLAHLEFVSRAVGKPAHPLRVCLDLDASLRLLSGRVHIGVRRSPVHSPDQARELARAVVAQPGLRLVGVMSYEAHIAGLGDNGPGGPLRRAAVRAVQRASRRELAERRAAAVAAVRSVAPLEFVNGGGTGSLESTSAEPCVTEVAAGSGLYGPALFDTYRRFRPAPAAFFVLPVVRRPSPDLATVLGGGWVASGAAGVDRLPSPVWPPDLRLTGTEGAGEVQTPLTGPGAARLRLGDRVWWRHCKAGELAERVDTLHLVDGGRIVDAVPTYRGEGRAFL
jgi:D-serine deaminase-like pyridoxal phosphate-dependent protein